jgi:hypothetical protein
MKISKEFKRFSAWDGYCSYERISVKRSHGIWECKWTVLCGSHVVSEEIFTGRKAVLEVLRVSR